MEEEFMQNNPAFESLMNSPQKLNINEDKSTIERYTKIFGCKNDLNSMQYINGRIKTLQKLHDETLFLRRKVKIE